MCPQTQESNHKPTQSNPPQRLLYPSSDIVQSRCGYSVPFHIFRDMGEGIVISSGLRSNCGLLLFLFSWPKEAIKVDCHKAVYFVWSALNCGKFPIWNGTRNLGSKINVCMFLHIFSNMACLTHFIIRIEAQKPSVDFWASEKKLEKINKPKK